MIIKAIRSHCRNVHAYLAFDPFYELARNHDARRYIRHDLNNLETGWTQSESQRDQCKERGPTNIHH